MASSTAVVRYGRGFPSPDSGNIQMSRCGVAAPSFSKTNFSKTKNRPSGDHSRGITKVPGSGGKSSRSETAPLAGFSYSAIVLVGPDVNTTCDPSGDQMGLKAGAVVIRVLTSRS